MRLLFAACFNATLLVLITVHGTESGVSDNQTPSNTVNTCDKTNVCTAMKNLETKLENLIALVKNTSTSQLTPPSKFGLTDFLSIFLLLFLSFFSE